MRLYHYTSPDPSHLGSIIEEKVIWTTESNIDIATGYGPRVVWLTKDADVREPLWAVGSPKDRVRFTLELPASVTFSWEGWARRQGMHPRHMRTLVVSGGGGEKNWYVCVRPIRWEEITDAAVRVSDQWLTIPLDELDLWVAPTWKDYEDLYEVTV
jgi:hypothetical protein